jgi:hypothetical protein
VFDGELLCEDCVISGNGSFAVSMMDGQNSLVSLTHCDLRDNGEGGEGGHVFSCDEDLLDLEGQGQEEEQIVMKYNNIFTFNCSGDDLSLSELIRRKRKQSSSCSPGRETRKRKLVDVDNCI